MFFMLLKMKFTLRYVHVCKMCSLHPKVSCFMWDLYVYKLNKISNIVVDT